MNVYYGPNLVKERKCEIVYLNASKKQPIQLHQHLEKLDYDCFSFSSSIQCSEFSAMFKI